MKEFKGIEGHIILYCKNHYNVEDVSLFEGLRKIWSIRCGYDYNPDDRSIDEYIANELYKIFMELYPNKVNYFHQILHKEINNYQYRDMTFLERLIKLYCCEIAFSTIREKKGNKWITIVKLPKAKKRIFKRIIRGNGRYDDYKLIAA